MTYIDGYVLPLPEKNIEKYREMATLAGKIWMEHGALAYKECVAEDMNPQWAAGSFPRAAQAKADEAVIFAFIIFKSREHRDEVNAKVHNDPRLKESCGSEADMPFDPSKMIYGGFTSIVDL